MNTVLIVILFLAIAFFFKKFFFDGTIGVKSTLDGEIYYVRNGPYKQRKADLLAFIKMKLTILVNTLKADPEYNNKSPVIRLLNNWNRGLTIKEIGLMESDAAYVINKQHMAFCLQDKPGVGNPVKTTSLEDTNLISYVCIHELAHMMSDETGHGTEFVQNFEFLLDYSKDITYTNPFTNKTEPLYIPLNQLKTSDNYCGVPLTNAIN